MKKESNLDLSMKDISIINRLLKKNYSFEQIISLDTQIILSMTDDIAVFMGNDTEKCEVEYTIARLLRFLGTRNDF